jgi:hypothetical protein
MPVADYYADFARAQFGREVGDEAGKIFACTDGEGFRPDMSGWGATWGAQGALQSSERRADLGTNAGVWSWAPGACNFELQAKAKGAIIDKLAVLRPRIAGAGNLQRFDYWLNTLRASVAMYEAGAVHGDLRNLVARMTSQKEPVQKKDLAAQAVALRIALTKVWDELMRLEILAADTPGELGIIANLERNSRTWDMWLTRFDKQITDVIGEALPASCVPAMSWDGPAMIKMLTIRTSVSQGESLKLKIIALGAANVEVHLRPLGQGRWRTIPAAHVARAVYEATLPAAQDDFEYYITAGKNLVWPAAAPQLNQTVVIQP